MENKGITLISLVITIVILILLAGVTINLTLGENGLFNKTKQAKEATNKQTATEIINLKITNCQMNKYAEEQRMPTLKELSVVLAQDNEISYVTETSKVASTEYDVPSENPSSVFTKLDKYPYEFEINSSLQLASIDGIKVATTNNDDLQTLQTKVDALTAKVNDLCDTVNNLQKSTDDIVSIISSVGETQRTSGKITATAGENSTICSLNLTERKIHFIRNGSG